MRQEGLWPVAPVAYEVILEPGIIGQFREFESPRVHTRINSWTFSSAQIDLQKARERELAKHSMKNRRAVGLLNPMRDKNWRQEPGGRRDNTCDHGLSRSWKVDVREKKKKNTTEDHNDSNEHPRYKQKNCDWFHDSPHPKTSGFFNGRFVAARHKEGLLRKKRIHVFYCVQRSSDRRRWVGVEGHRIYFGRHGPELVFETADFVEKKWGGATVDRLLCIPLFFTNHIWCWSQGSPVMVSQRNACRTRMLRLRPQELHFSKEKQ